MPAKAREDEAQQGIMGRQTRVTSDLVESLSRTARAAAEPSQPKLISGQARVGPDRGGGEA